MIRRPYDAEDREADDDFDNHHAIEYVNYRSVKSSNWIGINDRRCNFPENIDVGLEVVIDLRRGPFEEDAGPDEVAYEGYLGNSGPSLDYWYHTAMLVIFPRSRA